MTDTSIGAKKMTIHLSQDSHTEFYVYSLRRAGVNQRHSLEGTAIELINKGLEVEGSDLRIAKGVRTAQKQT